MILIKKTLKDADGVCEVARKFTGFGEYAFIYDLIGSEGYEEDEQDIPLCVINNDGNGFEIVFHPYEEKLRNILKLEYHEADYLKKLLSFIEKTNRDISQEPEVPCKTHPDAPHGFDRNASHSADRYVCECEGWEPDLARVGEVGVWGDKREWVGLTDEDMTELDEDGVLFARYIEAKLKEKNHE
jgi:dienelactone hydrolase